MLITERGGRLRMVRDGVLVAEPVSGLPTDIDASDFYSGLMDVAIHPEFARNRLVYLTYTRALDRGETVVLVRGRLEGMALTSVEEIFVASLTGGDPNRPVHDSGSRLAFAPDGTLFMTIGGAFEGDYPGDPKNADLAQNLASHAGKLLRLNADGSPPDDNPFVDEADSLPEIYSLRHRNQMGLALHPETGQPFATEHGMQGGDELNAIEPGGNYGWPLVTYGRRYDGRRVERVWQEGLQEPVVFWVPSIAPSGLTFYDGDRFPAWKGNVFTGAMRVGRIARTGHLQRIVLGETGGELRRESLLGEFRQRIRDVRQGPDGLLYLLTDGQDPAGRAYQPALLRLEPVSR
jgi:glucose/arabinose dehydrogenase